MRKMWILLLIMAFMITAIPAFAGTGWKVQKTATSETQTDNGGSLGTQTINVDHYGTLPDGSWGVIDHQNPWSNSFATMLYLNSSILSELMGLYANNAPILAILTQISLQTAPAVGTELALTTAISSQLSDADLAALASSYAVGERGSVYASNQNSVQYGISTETDTVYGSGNRTLTQVTTATTHQIKYTVYDQTDTRWISPIVLDMTGKGVIEASGGKYYQHYTMDTKNIMLVDFYNNGFEVAMEWVGPNDGLLVAPKADGSIDMTCTFGTTGGYDDGYQKLSLWDKNKDNQIAGDELNGLMIWQDKNQNGNANKDELISVNDAGITSISTKHKAYVSSFVRNGKACKMWDWWPTAMELNKVATK